MSSDASQPPVPPGWYPDPRRQFELRWWDGTEWTEHTHNYDAPAAPKKSAGSGWMQSTIRAVTSRAGHVFTLALLLSSIPAALLAAASWWVTENLLVVYQIDPPEMTATGFDSARIPVVVAVMVFTFVTSALFGAAVRRQTIGAVNGRPVEWSVSLLATLRRAPRVLLVWLSWVLAMLVAGFVALVVVSLVGAVVPVLLLLVLPAMVVAYVIVLLQISLVPAAAALAPHGVSAWKEGLAAATGHRKDLLVRSFMIWIITVSAQTLLGSMVSGILGGQSAAIERTGEGTDGADLLEITRENLLGGNIAYAIASGLVVAIIGAFAGAARSTGFGLAYTEFGGSLDPELTEAGGSDSSMDASAAPLAE